MAQNEAQEIEMQTNELLRAGLIEAFPPGEIPLFCSPTFLVDKKESKTKRMVIQFCKPLEFIFSKVVCQTDDVCRKENTLQRDKVTLAIIPCRNEQA